MQPIQAIGQNQSSAFEATIALEAEPALQAPDENKTNAVGEETLDRLRKLLASGQPHIVGAGVAGPPVVVATAGAALCCATSPDSEPVDTSPYRTSVNTEQNQSSAFEATIALEAEPAVRVPDDRKILRLGEETVKRLQTLLASGQAHIVRAGAAGVPVVVGPIANTRMADFANRNLGWDLTASANGVPRPGGKPIGVLVYDWKRNNEPVVLIDPRAAVSLMQGRWRHNGYSLAATWKAVWLTSKCYSLTWTRSGYRIKVMVKGKIFTGVPFSLALLANIGEPGVEDLDCRKNPTAWSDSTSCTPR